MAKQNAKSSSVPKLASRHFIVSTVNLGACLHTYGTVQVSTALECGGDIAITKWSLQDVWIN